MRLLLIILLVLPLGGCFKSAAQMQAEIDAKDDRECRSYGAQPGSPAYVQCRATRASAHEMSDAAAPPPAPAPAQTYGSPPPPLPNIVPQHQNCVTTYNPTMRASYTTCR